MVHPLQKESIFIPIGSESDRLHLKRFWTRPEGIPVFMVHGAIENGRIFYSESDKGLACFLAHQGYDVYVADLRGRGLSTPPISVQSKHGQTNSITEEIPLFVEAIRTRRGSVPQIWMAHSWGGVLLLASFARVPEVRNFVSSMVFFGTKRSVRVQNPEKWLKINFFWNFFGRMLTWKYGYLPAKEWRMGADNETLLSHLHSIEWVKPGPWIDPSDGFNYGEAIQDAPLPPVLYLAGNRDYCLGHPYDVQCLMRETGSKKAEYRTLSGYGHIDMLTSPRAVKDHFVDVLSWIKNSYPNS